VRAGPPSGSISYHEHAITHLLTFPSGKEHGRPRQDHLVCQNRPGYIPQTRQPRRTLCCLDRVRSYRLDACSHRRIAGLTTPKAVAANTGVNEGCAGIRSHDNYRDITETYGLHRFDRSPCDSRLHQADFVPLGCRGSYNRH
jgi:hypothetical protein